MSHLRFTRLLVSQVLFCLIYVILVYWWSQQQQTQAEKWGDGSHRGRKVSQWTDDAVDQLLDRSAVEEQVAAPARQGEEGEAAASNSNALGSLLQTFKVRRGTEGGGGMCVAGDW